MSLLEARINDTADARIERLNARATVRLVAELHAFEPPDELRALKRRGCTALRFRGPDLDRTGEWLPIDTLIHLAAWDPDEQVLCPDCGHEGVGLDRDGNAAVCESCNERELESRAAFERAHSAEVLG